MSKKIHPSYLHMIAERPLRSIKTKKQYNQALEFLGAHEPEDKGEELYFDALVDLMSVYEEAQNDNDLGDGGEDKV